MAANPKLEALLPFVRGNMGLIFTNDDLAKVRSIVTEYKVSGGAASKPRPRAFALACAGRDRCR